MISREEAIARIKKIICNDKNGLCRDACLYGKNHCEWEMAISDMQKLEKIEIALGYKMCNVFQQD